MDVDQYRDKVYQTLEENKATGESKEWFDRTFFEHLKVSKNISLQEAEINYHKAYIDFYIAGAVLESTKKRVELEMVAYITDDIAKPINPEQSEKMQKWYKELLKSKGVSVFQKDPGGNWHHD